MGKASTRKKLSRPSAKDGGCAGFEFVEIGSDEGFIVVAIGGEEENVFIAGKFGGDFFIERFEGAARTTPSRPKIHY